MEVSESKWIHKAINNVDKYLHRGGHLKGDKPQLLGGTDLLNTIGVAMGLPFTDPSNWSKSELKRALNNDLVYFEGVARKAIDVIANQIRRCCEGDDTNFVTVLPIEIYISGKLYELPVFRVRRYSKSKKYYVDNIGRSYDSVEDWFDNNKLPPGKMAYPYDLKLTLKPGYIYSRVLVDNTPSSRVGSKLAKATDFTAGVVGMGSSIGLLFTTGGLATPLVIIGVATSVWGTTRTGYKLIDKAIHGENINPITNAENRLLWLGIAANLTGFGATGASMRLSFLASRGRHISNSLKILFNVMNDTHVVVSGLSMLDSTMFMIDHANQFSNFDILMHTMTFAFWNKNIYTYKTAQDLIKNVQDETFKAISEELHPYDANRLAVIRNLFNNDEQLLRALHRASEENISVETFCSHYI